MMVMVMVRVLFCRAQADCRDGVGGRKLTKEEREAEVEKHRHVLKEMERDRKRAAKMETKEARSQAVRDRMAYEDAHLGGFVRIFPDKANSYAEFEKVRRVTLG